MSATLFEMEKSRKNFRAAFVEAEELPEVSLSCNITAAPTALFFKDGKEIDRINGSNPPELNRKIRAYTVGAGAGVAHIAKDTEQPKQNLNDKLKGLISKSRLMLFMKGNPAEPKCGFSRQTIEILLEAGADFGTFDILADEEVRQGLKEYSNWPTYPQLYLDGELVGGLDVIREEMKDSAFVDKLPKKVSLNDKLKSLINSARLMLFMKGNRDQPRCGFSRQTIQLLQDINADFSTFDILSDEEVRQGLKEYSNWPTYPQLYLDGELIGGLDVIREELNDAEFVNKLPKIA